ncbi:hypothetical protein JOC37_000526 [Desulfohalotomaculum tongense]|uniref:hypothetical protein n=1 Tax=Desulforadius tongensis TaxID=1216062 RepID=UPI0019574BF9|nr:hypothetical protein [Desulforadius tongensis]MBM7854154.1 hypothetical protein [Desulforadius tongensis]
MFKYPRLGWWVVHLGILSLLSFIAVKMFSGQNKDVITANLAYPKQMPVDREP